MLFLGYNETMSRSKRKIPLTESTQKAVAQNLAYSSFYNLRGLDSFRQGKVTLEFPLFIKVWHGFVRGFDEFLNSNTLKDGIIRYSEEVGSDGPFETLTEIKENTDCCIAEFVLRGLFLKGCMEHRPYSEEFMDELTQDVACRIYTLIHADIIRLRKFKEE